jgi:hypothetical protein
MLATLRTANTCEVPFGRASDPASAILRLARSLGVAFAPALDPCLCDFDRRGAAFSSNDTRTRKSRAATILARRMGKRRPSIRRRAWRNDLSTTRDCIIHSRSGHVAFYIG